MARSFYQAVKLPQKKQTLNPYKKWKKFIVFTVRRSKIKRSQEPYYHNTGGCPYMRCQ